MRYSDANGENVEIGFEEIFLEGLYGQSSFDDDDAKIPWQEAEAIRNRLIGGEKL